MDAEAKDGEWVLGGGWNNEKWGGELPSASWIDDFTKEIPVRISKGIFFKINSSLFCRIYSYKYVSHAPTKRKKKRNKIIIVPIFCRCGFIV